MSTRLLTFLGTGNYQPCAYRIEDASATDPVTFFSVALAASLKPDLVISLQTAGAADKHGPALDDALAKLGLKHQPVTIPEGKSEAELWQIFSALTEHIPEGCTLHLDITHGFRSLPLLGFIALSYLRVTRKVAIGGIHYGAWEARDENNNAPVFDLTPFLTLLDWTAAADQFFTTGSATKLGKLLSQAQQSLWQNRGGQQQSKLPTKLKSLGASLGDTSSNILLLRTGSLKSSADTLVGHLDEAKAEAETHASPFLELLAPVKDQLTRFNNTDLDTLRDLVGWLAERGQTAAALTLASEWLTSYVMVKCGQTSHHAAYHSRKPYSLAISKLEQPEMNITPDETGNAAIAAIAQLENTLTAEQLLLLKSLSSTIRNARNDLNHAGFNDNPAPATVLIKRAQEVAEKLRQLTI